MDADRFGRFSERKFERVSYKMLHLRKGLAELEGDAVKIAELEEAHANSHTAKIRNFRFQALKKSR